MLSLYSTFPTTAACYSSTAACYSFDLATAEGFVDKVFYRIREVWNLNQVIDSSPTRWHAGAPPSTSRGCFR